MANDKNRMNSEEINLYRENPTIGNGTLCDYFNWMREYSSECSY